MVKDRSLFRKQVSTALGTCVTSTSWMLVELRPLALRTLWLWETCFEEIRKTSSVIGERVLEV